jgi:hypothetical protein
LSLRTKLSFNFLKWHVTHFQDYFSIHRFVLLKNCSLLSNHTIFVLNYIFMFVESFFTSFQIILHQLWSLLAFEVIECSCILNCVIAMFYCVLLLCFASHCKTVIFEQATSLFSSKLQRFQLSQCNHFHSTFKCFLFGVTFSLQCCYYWTSNIIVIFIVFIFFFKFSPWYCKIIIILFQLIQVVLWMQ